MKNQEIEEKARELADMVGSVAVDENLPLEVIEMTADKKKLEIDPLNYIYYVNGKDYLADVRKALGK